jgi:hypothetical protein
MKLGIKQRSPIFAALHDTQHSIRSKLMKAGSVSGLLIYGLHCQGLFLPFAMAFADLKFQISGNLNKNMGPFL